MELKKIGWAGGVGWSGSGQGKVAVCCEHSYETSSSI